MRSRRIALLTALFVAGLVAVPAQAVLLVSHPFGSEAGWCTPCEDQFRVWDSFQLTEASSISSIDVRLDIDPTAYFGDINFSIWNAGRTTELFSQSFSLSDLSPVVSPENEFYYDMSANVASWSLEAGTYALSIFGGDTSTFLGWVQSSQTGAGGSVQVPDLGGGGSGLDMSFRIFGDPVVSVPEPGPLALLATGLLGLALLRRRDLRTVRVGR